MNRSNNSSQSGRPPSRQNRRKKIKKSVRKNKVVTRSQTLRQSKASKVIKNNKKT